MKRIFYAAICLLLMAIVFGVTGCDSFSPPSTTSSDGGSESQASGIWVTGTGEVTVTPDIAILQVGVEAQEKTVAEAMDNANGAMANIGTALTTNGVESEDIQTHYFNIQQRAAGCHPDNTQPVILSGDDSGDVGPVSVDVIGREAFREIGLSYYLPSELIVILVNAGIKDGDCCSVASCAKLA